MLIVFWLDMVSSPLLRYDVMIKEIGVKHSIYLDLEIYVKLVELISDILF